MGLIERTWFELTLLANSWHLSEFNFPTKSRQDPPPRYSITIQSLCPRKKLSLYWVTYGLAHVLSTAISCWISWISSSLDSRSIYDQRQPLHLGRTRLALTCFIATISPVALSIALYTIPKLPPNFINVLLQNILGTTHCLTPQVPDIDSPQIRPTYCSLFYWQWVSKLLFESLRCRSCRAQGLSLCLLRCSVWS